MTETTVINNIDDLIESSHNFAYAMAMLQDPASSDELYEGLRIAREEYCRVNTLARILLHKEEPSNDGLTLLIEDGFVRKKYDPSICGFEKVLTMSKEERKELFDRIKSEGVHSNFDYVFNEYEYPEGSLIKPIKELESDANFRKDDNQ